MREKCYINMRKAGSTISKIFQSHKPDLSTEWFDHGGASERISKKKINKYEYKDISAIYFHVILRLRFRYFKKYLSDHRTYINLSISTLISILHRCLRLQCIQTIQSWDKIGRDLPKQTNYTQNFIFDYNTFFMMKILFSAREVNSSLRSFLVTSKL